MCENSKKNSLTKNKSGNCCEEVNLIVSSQRSDLGFSFFSMFMLK